MTAVSSWLLSIASVILLSVIAEFVLPEGQINNYVKVIFSFIILLVIIMPLPNLFGRQFNFNNFWEESESDLQEDYLYQLNIDKLTSLNEDLANDIEEAGLKNVVVSINANVLCENLEIYGVYVDLCDIEYTQKFVSKDISKAKLVICELIDNYSLLKDVEVSFNEQD